MRNHYKRYLFLFCSLAALLLGLSGIGVPFAQGHVRLASLQKTASQTCGAWSVVTSPNPSSLENHLNDVAAVSTNDVWAVGDYYNSSGQDVTLTEQWNGTSWNVVTSPNVASYDNRLYAVAAVSASDIWAVGDYFNQNTNPVKTMTMHWNGTNWSLVFSPSTTSTTNLLSGVAAISTSDVWAVGDYATSTGSNRALTLHWNGTKWSPVSPNVGQSSLSDVAAVSTNDVWAVGGNVTLQWNGTSWGPVSNPNVSSSNLIGVATVSTSDVWAVGIYDNSGIGNYQTLTEQWNGTSWSVVSSPSPGSINYLVGVATVSSDVWAVGYYVNSTGFTSSLIEFYC